MQEQHSGPGDRQIRGGRPRQQRKSGYLRHHCTGIHIRNVLRLGIPICRRDEHRRPGAREGRIRGIPAAGDRRRAGNVKINTDRKSIGDRT